MARFQNLYDRERKWISEHDLISHFSLTFEFAPLAGDEIERVGITRDDVLSSVSRRATKDDNLRF